MGASRHDLALLVRFGVKETGNPSVGVFVCGGKNIFWVTQGQSRITHVCIQHALVHMGQMALLCIHEMFKDTYGHTDAVMITGRNIFSYVNQRLWLNKY